MEQIDDDVVHQLMKTAVRAKSFDYLSTFIIICLLQRCLQTIVSLVSLSVLHFNLFSNCETSLLFQSMAGHIKAKAYQPMTDLILTCQITELNDNPASLGWFMVSSWSELSLLKIILNSGWTSIHTDQIFLPHQIKLVPIAIVKSLKHHTSHLITSCSNQFHLHY